ncbi:dihydroorotate dehydrogenase 2 [Nitratireductor indicus C115]|uniref:Dihydroorotate dehydrogenase (quinone) n=1 Tax=Nitratireductor indicus C115 TaxID=1231190 RepID=K2PBN4_9HYPH|nr:quinone-dependent dihydroorotate dehydrogenase [Nitratireductor indicus]EKF44556.1 dihydroorotate dehydrogenase 2 [Nitratireductor indicus C115]SFQ31304.1 dihydroorotate oxidase A [Nitratireductor indicus]
MNPTLDRLARQALFRLNPEHAHRLAIMALKSGVPVCGEREASRRLKTIVAGMVFPNPLGLAAGFDKNAEAPDGILRLGFGFVECGTVTPQPQAGNPRPRLFRLEEDRALINRLGFNNDGLVAVRERLKQRANNGGIVGVNIGANKDSADRIADYETGVRAFGDIASYLAVNISSPNTVGLRALQDRENLSELLKRVLAARDEVAKQRRAPIPLFLKIAPDLTEDAMADIAVEVLDKRIDGLIISNTTLSRRGATSRKAHETGGLSGQPLFERSTMVLARMRRLVGPAMPLIGVGGVHSTETALEKIRAGADLVQIYTSMIFGGASLPGQIVAGMSAYAQRENLTSLRQIRDSRVDAWAERQLD